MLRVSNDVPRAMEFTTFSKVEGVSDEQLINSVMRFEGQYMAHQEGIIFHCLVRNLSGDYANLVFFDDMNSLNEFPKGFMSSEACQLFLKCVDKDTVKMHHHTIMKNNFVIPEFFSCFEHGTFAVKKDIGFTEEKLLSISTNLEKQYLDAFDNTLGHFIGKLDDGKYSELVFGKAFGRTREICFDYLGVDEGRQLIDLCEPQSSKLDFWYLIA